MNKNFKIIIAGGKTGGHLFPGIAIAQAVLRVNPDADILFVGTDAPFERGTLARYGFAHERISSAGIKGKGWGEKIRALLQIPLSLIQAAVIVRRFRPDIVVGVGGFSSGPVVLGARLCGVKTAIQEQNSIAGITNRILARFVHLIFTSFKETKGLMPSRRVIHTGNPIRRDEISLSDKGGTDISLEDGKSFFIDKKSSSTDAEYGETKRFTILVTGGSQGARSINTAFLDALQLMRYRGQYKIIHQTGATDEKRVLMAYKEMTGHKNADDFEQPDNFWESGRISAKAFFNDMPKMQSIADLIICRAGAGTISEITAVGKASLLVPYPYAADDHQTYNAKSLADRGAAWMVPDHQLSGEFLKERIEFAYTHPDELLKMGQRAKELGNPFADETIASICIKMATGLS